MDKLSCMVRRIWTRQDPRYQFTALFDAQQKETIQWKNTCLLYTSDAADDLLCVDLGGRRIIKKKKKNIKIKKEIAQRQPLLR